MMQTFQIKLTLLIDDVISDFVISHADFSETNSVFNLEHSSLASESCSSMQDTSCCRAWISSF